jgi:hypothetical protein
MGIGVGSVPVIAPAIHHSCLCFPCVHQYNTHTSCRTKGRYNEKRTAEFRRDSNQEQQKVVSKYKIQHLFVSLSNFFSFYLTDT